MTDRDDRQPDDRLQLPNSAHDDVGNVEARRGEARAHHDRTDPEVPSAKRKGARQRRGTLVALSALVGGLLTMALSLLYRASEKVSETANGRLSGPLHHVANPEATTVSSHSLLSMSERRQDHYTQGSVEKESVLPPYEAPDASHPPAPGASSQSKGAPANGIIRPPAF
jgi:hypothetical protein